MKWYCFISNVGGFHFEWEHNLKHTSHQHDDSKQAKGTIKWLIIKWVGQLADKEAY